MGNSIIEAQQEYFEFHWAPVRYPLLPTTASLLWDSKLRKESQPEEDVRIVHMRSRMFNPEYGVRIEREPFWHRFRFQLVWPRLPRIP